MKLVYKFLFFLFLFIVLAHQNCSRVKFDEAQSQSSSLEISAAVPDDSEPVASAAVEAKACQPPTNDNRGAITSGSGRIYFETAVNNVFCDKAQFRGCLDGTLSGSFTKTSCSIKFKAGGSQNSSCQTPIGSIDHGSTILLFDTTASNECSAQLRTCDNGILSGDNTYNKTHCRLASMPVSGRSCKLNWNNATIEIAPKSRVIGFVADKAKTEEGATCRLTTARCDDGVLMENANLTSSCREKRIEELPEGFLLTEHTFNGSKVSLEYKISAASTGRDCKVEYRIGNSWFLAPNVSTDFNCMAAPGQVKKTIIDLSKIPSFAWTASVNSAGGLEYKSKLRIHFDSSTTEANKELLCFKQNINDVLGVTPEVDEDCNGSF